MKTISMPFVLCLALGGMAAAQTQSPSPAPSLPTLSTADKVALESLEQKKQAAQKDYMAAYQTELQIEREFSADHPGWHLDAQTFSVEKDATPPAPQKAKK